MRRHVYLLVLLVGIVLLTVSLIPTTASAGSLRASLDPWPAHGFQSAPGGTSIPFVYYKGHIFVTVSVNGQPGYVFLLDTGTSVNILDLNVCRELGIPIERIKHIRHLGFGSGRVSIAGARHLDLRLQSLKVGKFAAIVDLQGLASVMQHPIDGILGYPLLQRFVVGINFATHELTLWQAYRFTYQGRGNVMYLVEHNHVPGISITLNAANRRRRAMVELDTGSNASLLLYPRYAERVHIASVFFPINIEANPKKKAKQMEGYGLGGSFPVLRARFASMTLGTTLFSNFPAFLMQTDPEIARKKFSGIIGTSVMSAYRRVIFDVPDHRVILEPPPPPPPQTAKLRD